MSSSRDMIDRQLSELFTQEVSSARLPQSVWSELAPRLGDPDSPGLLWKLRRVWPDFHIGETSMTRFLAPAATIVLIALAVAMFIFFMNSDDTSAPVPAGSPTPSNEVPTPVVSPALTRDQAMTLAMDELSRDGQGVTAVDSPRDMVARLMRVRDIPDRDDGVMTLVSPRDDNSLVWLSQVEGTSSATASEADENVTYRYNAVALDAGTGDVVARMRSQYQPFILPLEILPDEIADADIDERNIRRDSLPVDQDDALAIVVDLLKNDRGADVDSIEMTLVRYSNPVEPGSGGFGSTATPRAAGPEPTSTSGPSPTPTQQLGLPTATATPAIDRLSWLVVVPSHPGFSSCLISGPSREFRQTCFMTLSYLFIDAETGTVYHSDGQKVIFGPSVTSEERQALQRFAWAEGWWALWHEIREYSGQGRLPEGLAAQLDRPNAPTPTPFPPTATPPADSTPTATPTPAPTITPVPMQVTRVSSFDSPVSGTVFEDILALVPDAEIPREMTRLSDIAGVHERYGLMRPEPGTDVNDSELFDEYGQMLNDLFLQGYPMDISVWPFESRRYVSQTNRYPYVAFDWLSADQIAYSRPRGSGPSRFAYEIAVGQFDPQATADALAACECDQPDIRDRNGTLFYSWGEEFIGQIENRNDPPMYDHVGRGPRLMVRDGAAYYSISDKAMEDMADAVNGDITSLADDSDYILTLRWLAALGDISETYFSSTLLSFSEFEDGSNYAEEINSAPLLKKFDMVGTALGHDGERKFTGLVIVNPDQETANQNADLLELRLREASYIFGSDSKWSDEIDLVEIQVEGNLIVARLYMDNINDYLPEAVIYALAVSE